MSIGMVAGTQVLTEVGLKNVEYVKVGDKVLTHMGKFQKVLDNRERIYRGEIIQFGVFKKPDIKCDSDTQFYSQDADGNRIWKPAREIRPKDYVCIETIDDEGVHGEWVKIRSIMRIGSSCRYLYGLLVEDDASYTANGYIVNGVK